MTPSLSECLGHPVQPKAGEQLQPAVPSLSNTPSPSPSPPTRGVTLPDMLCRGPGQTSPPAAHPTTGAEGCHGPATMSCVSLRVRHDLCVEACDGLLRALPACQSIGHTDWHHLTTWVDVHPTPGQPWGHPPPPQKNSGRHPRSHTYPLSPVQRSVPSSHPRRPCQPASPRAEP